MYKISTLFSASISVIKVSRGEELEADIGLVGGCSKC